MQFHVTETGVLRVMVSDAELVRLGLSFEELDRECPKTQTALETVLQTAKDQVGFALTDRLCIEAVPIEGGCLLLFTPEGRRRRPRRAAPPSVWRFENADALLGFATALRPFAGAVQRRQDGCASSLFRQGDTYGLVIYAPSLLPRGIVPLLSEFAKHNSGCACAAAVEEHETPVCLQKALLKLSYSC